jgi:hypothetical protein
MSLKKLLKRSRRHILFVAPLFVLLGGIGGCSKEGVQRPYVARVGNAELREDAVPGYNDSTGASGQEAQEYINEWIVNELLYQEASRRGLAESEEIQRLLQEARKRLAVNALLEREVYAADSSSVSDDAIASFFNAHMQSFALREDVVNASYVVFSSRDAANTFRSRVLRGAGWNDAVAQIQQDSVLRSSLIGVATQQYFTQDRLYPDELWKLARSLGREEVSFVVRTGRGYYVLKLHGIKHQGDIPDLAYVREEVRDRILIEQRRQTYEKLIAGLRARYSVQIRLGAADTTEFPD